MNKYEILDKKMNRMIDILIKMIVYSIGLLTAGMFLIAIVQMKYNLNLNDMYKVTIDQKEIGIVMIVCSIWFMLLLAGLIVQLFIFGPICLYISCKKSLKFFKKRYDPKVITKEEVSKRIHEIAEQKIGKGNEKIDNILQYIYEILMVELTLKYQMKCHNETEFLQTFVDTMKTEEFISIIKKRKAKDLKTKIEKFVRETADYAGWDHEDSQIENYIESEIKQLDASFQTILSNSKMFKDLRVTKNC